MKKVNRFFRPLPFPNRSRTIYWSDIYPSTISLLLLLKIDLHEIVPLPGRLSEVLFLYIPFLLFVAPIWDLKDRAFPKEMPETEEGEELVKLYRRSLAWRVTFLVAICLVLIWGKLNGTLAI